MNHVYVYPADCEDFDTTGLVGALYATMCEHEEAANGESTLTLEHPYDPSGKFRALQVGNILKADCHVRTTPEIANGQIVTSVEMWTVKNTATKAERGVFSKAKKGKKKTTLKPGASVVVTLKGEERYKIKTGKVTGWIAHSALDYQLSETLPGGADGIETVLPAIEVKPQLFEIQSVERSTKGRTITVRAEHISCCANYTLATYQNDEPLTAQQAINGIMAGCDSETDIEIYTDSGDTRTSCDWEDISVTQALLDPEDGFGVRWGLDLVRDDYAMYFLRQVGRNRGVRIEHGKNLKAAVMEIEHSSVITAIKPRGVNKDGSVLYLTDDPRSPANYVLSPNASLYPMLRCMAFDGADCTVGKGKKGVTLDIARQRLREQAERKFADEHIDEPAIKLTVNLVELNDTVQFAHYKALARVELYDEVPVVATRYGIEVQTRVQRTRRDCLRGGRLIEVELGNVREGVGSIYSWQIPNFSGDKVINGTLPGAALEDGTVPIFKLDPDLQAALDKAWADIDSAKERLTQYHQWLDELDYQLETVTVAVGDNEGNIAALQVAADEFRTAVRNAEGEIAALTIRADIAAFDLENALGDINTLQLTATETSSTITNLEGSISSVRQTASDIKSTVSALNGRVSQIAQTVDSIGFKLSDPELNANFEVRISQKPSWSSFLDSSYYGMGFYTNGDYQAFIGTKTIAGYPFLSLESQCQINLFAKYMVALQTSESDLALVLDGEGNRIYSTKSITNASDARLKKDIAPIKHGEALFDAIIPYQYRMIADGPDGRLNYGCMAQNVQEARRTLGLPPIEMLSEHDDPEKMMGLNYEQFVALTMHKLRCVEARHQSRIDELERRIEALERRRA